MNTTTSKNIQPKAGRRDDAEIRNAKKKLRIDNLRAHLPVPKHKYYLTAQLVTTKSLPVRAITTPQFYSYVTISAKDHPTTSENHQDAVPGEKRVTTAQPLATAQLTVRATIALRKYESITLPGEKRYE